MNNNEFLIKKFRDFHADGYPTFLCGSETQALLAYPTILNDRCKMVYISSTLEEINVNVVDVGAKMLVEFAKYVLFFDEEASYNIVQFFELCDDANAVLCKRNDVEKTVDNFFGESQAKRWTFDEIVNFLHFAAPELIDKYYASIEDCEDGECPCCAAMKNAGRTSKH